MIFIKKEFYISSDYQTTNVKSLWVIIDYLDQAAVR